ncbi:MAG: alpha/beta fold hydrolase [Clostridia bacterium]|nr:alpha/beta fold hydrolase [Clostridia bacterium]
MIFEKTILNVYKSNICIRHDGNPLLHYFSVSDFPGLQRTPFDFEGNAGQKLQGYYYYYASPRKDRLIIFDHGMGNGHVAYIKEIELIARRGYTVFTYDHTGCLESEGEGCVGFAQSLCDLDYAINALHAAKEWKDAKFTVIGHSWGGFAALNISALHPEIESCVSLSGFIGVERMIEQFFSGILKFYRPSVLRLEHESNPMHSLIDARKSLKNSKSRILYIASDNDPTVKTAYHFDTLKNAVPEGAYIEFHLVKNRLHNPNYTDAAVAELTKMSKAMTEGIKKKAFDTPEAVDAFRTSWDWNKITEQDEDLWNKIFDFIEGRSSK